MAQIRLLVARNQAEAFAMLAKVDASWQLIEQASGDFSTLHYWRSDATLGAPESFSVTDSDGMLHVMVLTRG